MEKGLVNLIQIIDTFFFRNVCAIMKIILRLLGCFLAFRRGAITRAGPRWLETWFPLLLYRYFLPEPVLASSQPGRWVTAPHLPSRLEASWSHWTAAVVVQAVVVPDGQERNFSRDTSPTCLQRIFSWRVDRARNYERCQSDSFLPHQWWKGLSIPTIKP